MTPNPPTCSGQRSRRDCQKPILWIWWIQVAQDYSLDYANMSNAVSTKYTWAAGRVAVRIQLGMTNPGTLELACSTPSLAPCSVCTTEQLHVKEIKWQEITANKLCINCLRIFSTDRKGVYWDSMKNALTGTEKISQRFLQSQRQVCSQQTHCWPPTSMLQGYLLPWFYLHLV